LKTTPSTNLEHLSPFRYPGGKSWLVPHIKQWLDSSKEPRIFVEPFAGGAAVSLAVAKRNWADHILMCEIDPAVAAVWNVVLNGEAKWLQDQITGFRLNSRSLKKQLKQRPRTERDKAFQTLLRNRTSHGGLIAIGSAPLRSGENKRGITSRWYPETLEKRLKMIARLRKKLTFVPGDGVQLVEALVNSKQCFFFFDPPYTAGASSAGKRMYDHHEIDHARLFGLANRMRGQFLMSYDDTEEIRLMAKAHKFAIKPVSMRTRLHEETHELLISRSLDWLKRR
jgi:DNA adenine methylase